MSGSRPSDRLSTTPGRPLVRVWLSGCQVCRPLALTSPRPAMCGTPDIGRKVLNGRDGVIRFQHRRKISSLLVRDTVVPIAVRTTSGSCLAIEASNHRKPGVVMSIIPLDVQRRCERRWAARFSRPTKSVTPRNQRAERNSQQIAGPDETKRKTHRVEAAGSRPLSAVCERRT